jgi:hypothetical protein
MILAQRSMLIQQAGERVYPAIDPMATRLTG